MMILMETIQPDSGAVIRSTSLKWHNPVSAAFLLRHLTWAFNNGYGVAFINKRDKPNVG